LSEFRGGSQADGQSHPSQVPTKKPLLFAAGTTNCEEVEFLFRILFLIAIELILESTMMHFSTIELFLS
jgi:hypothetical protein